MRGCDAGCSVWCWVRSGRPRSMGRSMIEEQHRPHSPDSGIKVDIFVRGDEPFDRVEFERHSAEVVQSEPELLQKVLLESARENSMKQPVEGEP